MQRGFRRYEYYELVEKALHTEAMSIRAKPEDKPQIISRPTHEITDKTRFRLIIKLEKFLA